MKKNIKAYISDCVPGFFVALFACFMLFVYAPLELYLTNADEFWFTIGQMLPVSLAMLALTLVLLCALLFAARLAGKKFYALLFALGAIAALSVYAQGSFLAAHLPGMDGTVVDWGAYPAERVKSVAVWVITAAALALLMKRFGVGKAQRWIGIGCLLLMLVQLITLVTLLLTTKVSKQNELSATDRDMFTFSQEKNVVVLILDAIDAEQFETAMARDDGYGEIFEDFTYFDNTLSGYPYSQCSAPLILTGEWYEAQEDFEQYVRRAVEESEFLNELCAQDYTSGIYTTETAFLKGLSKEQFTNLVDDQPAVRSQGMMAKFVLKMAAVKFAPWDLKFFGYDLLGRLPECRMADPRYGYEYFDWSNALFYNSVKDQNPISLSEGKQFKFIHLEGAHVPYQYNKAVEISADGDYWSSIEASITLCGAFFDCLRQAGIYDNTAILVMADHGYAKIEDERLSSWQQHPILLVKGFGEAHELYTDGAPISYGDLQQAYLRLLEGRSAAELFDWHEGDLRERRFLQYDWTNTDYFEEYSLDGDAGDTASLTPTGRVFERNK